TNQTLDFQHIENDYVDYNRDILLRQKYSTEGPALAIGDVNGDGLDDAYIGGSQEHPKFLYIQQKNGKMLPAKTEAFNRDNYLEIVDAIFFDADNDKDLDLYVVTGSNEYDPDAPQLRDRLYMNDGKGKGNYMVQTSKQTGFFTKGQVRKMRVINGLGGKKEVVLIMDLIINIPDKEAPFFLELLKKFDFVKVKQTENAQVLEGLESSLKQMKSMREGKLRKPSISELFYNE
ncbi:unnamed protein product, partial [Rotaria sordida]